MHQELTTEIIEQLKSIYGPDEPLMTYNEKRKANSQKFVFRQISHDMMKQVRKLVKDETLKGNLLPLEQVESFIFDECVVWPPISEEDKLNFQVGLVPQIVKNVQERSGFLDVDILDRPLRPSEYIEVITDFQYWGDISKEELEEIKEKTPFAIFKITVDRWVFVVRPLTKGDVLALQNSNDEELTGCKSVTVWPANVGWDGKIPGGVVKVLWKGIMDISGFQEEAVIEEL